MKALKEALIILATIASIICVLTLVGTFISLESPLTWTLGTRGAIVFFSVIIGGLIGGAILDSRLREQEEKDFKTHITKKMS